MLDDNDHRSLGKRLDLFHFREEAPGMVFWHPKGLVLYRLLEAAVRSHFRAAGYEEVRTPEVLRAPVWEASGHWQHFRGAMFALADQDVPAALKPVSCPGHVYIAEKRHPSYRDLPLRLAEFGSVHRDEPSGTLHGLLRLREFTQDDGHVFCAPAQAEPEIERFCRSVRPFYAHFGFKDVRVSLATRPLERVGSDTQWEHAEGALRRAAERAGLDYELAPGGGAFYGPKLEFTLADRLGRLWQCGTIQYDLHMPESFGLDYVNQDGSSERVSMLHRALYGSLERFLGVLLEHHGPRLPAWLAPEQLRVLPVGSAQERYALEVAERALELGLRVSVDPRGESLARRVAEATEAAVPFVGVAGAREMAEITLAVRCRERQDQAPLERALGDIARAAANPFAAVSSAVALVA